MRKVILHGRLRDRFGPEFALDVATAGEAFRALNANFPDRFLNEIAVGSYYVIRGDEETGMPLEEEHLNSFALGQADLHIIPAIEGSQGGGGRGKGGVKAILGVALVGIAVVMSGGLAGAGLAGFGAAAIPLVGGLNISWGTIALFGLAMAVSGASSMLSPKEKPKDETKRDDSFSFAGPINTNEQGNPVPLIYGRVMTGGNPISSGIDIENIGPGSGASGMGSGVGGFGQVLFNDVYVDVESRLLGPNWS